MANKEFQARHGLIVNTNLLIANVITGNVSVNGNVSISNSLAIGNTYLFQRANSLVISANGVDSLVISPNTTGVMLEIINTATQIRVFSVSDTGNVYSASNVYANYFYGNGALLSGIITTVDLTPANNWANTLYISALQNANNDANASNTWANTKLANTSGVSFAGNLYFPTGNVAIGNTTSIQKLEVVGNMAVSNFYENDTNVASNVTITAGRNAMSAGPITINSGVTVTVPSGSTWTIV